MMMFVYVWTSVVTLVHVASKSFQISILISSTFYIIIFDTVANNILGGCKDVA